MSEYDGNPREPRPGGSRPRPLDVRWARIPRLRRLLVRPRRPLGVRDLLPTGGGLFVPVLVAVVLTAGGLLELLGPGARFRPAGGFAVLGGAVVTAGIVLYLRRPPRGRG